MYNSRTVEELCGMPWIQMGIVKYYHLIFSGHFTGNICVMRVKFTYVLVLGRNFEILIL